MGPVKIVRVVSFSSEDSNQPAENLTKNDTFRKWRCKEPGESKAWIELQLEKLSTISSVDIGNHGSAFIEVLAGRTGSSEDEYKVLLHSSTFMTPQECRNGTNLQRVRIFKSGELNKATLAEKWDRVRVVCTQPFNKQLQYGISFITIHAEEDENKAASPQEKNKLDFGIFKLKEESTVEPVTQGSLFSRFKSLKTTPSYDSTKTQPGDLKAVSQSLAAAALNESEQEASRILKPSPRKVEERPNINLMQKLKTSAASPDNRSSDKSKRKEADDSPLPRRKFVDVDNIPAPSTPVAIASPKEVRKEKRRSSKVEKNANDLRSPEPKGKEPERKESSKKRKSTANEEENSVIKKRKSTAKSDSEEVKPPPVKKRQTKPFNRLLEGAVVVLSGYQNPLRSQLRDKLQAMGAKYKPDWGSSCTHLLCAFYNTPKFREVKGKGKIVTKEWVEECFKQRKRLPWRRFCLDKNDRGDESEEEIWEGEASSSNAHPTSASVSKKPEKTQAPKQPKPSTSIKEAEDDYGGSTEVDEPDTDDEIERIKKNQR